MTDADRPFIDAVVAAPDDDLPRLIYADWLGEHAGTVPCPFCSGEGCAQHGHGDAAGRCDGGGRVSDGQAERAELIRAQIRRLEIARLPLRNRRLDRESEMLGRRERKLLHRYELEWARPVGRMLGRGDGWRFKRGFIAEIHCGWEDFNAHADALLAACPIRRIWRDDERHPGGEWCGDGVVRLTTRPEFRSEARGDLNPPSMVLWLDGCRQRLRLTGTEGFDDGLVGPGLTDRLLAAEWPGVRFELPSPDPTESVRRAAQRLAREIADAEFPGMPTPRVSVGRNDTSADLRRVMRAMEGVAEAGRADAP